MAMAAVKKVKSVTRYEPGPLPEDKEDLGIYVVTELKRLGSIYADGSNWNPGAGTGIYWFDGSSWTKL
jgi:hypothetical protein